MDRYDSIDYKMEVLSDLKHRTHYNKHIGKWFWSGSGEDHEKCENWHGPFDTFTAAVDDAVEPYMGESEAD